MDDREFNRLLNLFPVVRSRDYCAQQDSTSGSASQSAKNEGIEWKEAWDEMDDKDNVKEGVFWQKLRLAAEKKLGPADAEQFCKAFQRAHEKLVYEELSSEVAKKFINHNSS